MFSCCVRDGPPAPEKPRICTDVICLVIFLLFWGLLIFISAFACVVGNPYRLAYGQDSFGNTCGMKNEELGNMTFSGMDMTHRPYLFFLNMTDLSNSLKICVKNCPKETLWNDDDIRNFESDSDSHLCRYDIAKFMGRSKLYPVLRNETVEKYFLHVENNGHFACPKPPIYATKPIFKRCVPLQVANFASDTIYSVYGYLNSIDVIQQVVSDIFRAKNEMIIMAALAVLLSVLVVIFIHKLASYVSWILMVIASLACIAGTCVLWWTYVDIKWQLDSTPFNQLLSESVYNEHTFLVCSIMATIFTFILLLLVLVMRKRVNVVVCLFNEASDCIRDLPFLLFQGLTTFIALFVFLTYWTIVLVALASAYYPVKNRVENPLQLMSSAPSNASFHAAASTEEEKLLNRAFTLVSFSKGSWVQYMWWYHIFALIWISEFIIGCQQMVIAGAAARWYFSRYRPNLQNVILEAIFNLVVFNMGSVALGAFLITVFKIPRLILTYMISYMKKHEEWKCVAWCLKCCTCCLWCMEKCIRYVNHNAYTLVAVKSVGFCTAAREAIDILSSNALQVATINSVGDFILFLGKCSVAAITAFSSILLLKNDPELHYYAIPVILISVIAYYIAHSILSIYELVIDTLFLCCCEDLRQNDGSEEKPYFGGKIIRYIKGDEDIKMHYMPINKVRDGSEGE